MDAGLDLCLDLLDGRAGRGRGGGALEERVDRLHRPVFDRLDRVPVDGDAADFHGVFQVVGRFRFRRTGGGGGFVQFLHQTVVLGEGRRRGEDSVLLEVPLGHAVDRHGDVSAAHLVDAELGSLDGGGGRGRFLDAVLGLELGRRSGLFLVLFGDLLLFDDRFLDGDRLGSVRGHFAALGGFGDDHLGALGHGRRGGGGGGHFLVLVRFLNVGRRQNGVAITEFGVVLFEHGVVVAQTDGLGQELERRQLERVVREEVRLLGELV